MLKRQHTAQRKPAPVKKVSPTPQLVWVGQHPRQPLYIYPEKQNLVRRKSLRSKV
jgi:hypothetical protein